MSHVSFGDAIVATTAAVSWTSATPVAFTSATFVAPVKGILVAKSTLVIFFELVTGRVILEEDAAEHRGGGDQSENYSKKETLPMSSLMEVLVSRGSTSPLMPFCSGRCRRRGSVGRRPWCCRLRGRYGRTVVDLDSDVSMAEKERTKSTNGWQRNSTRVASSTVR
ncbi:hypothetical protein BHE74_00038263 [Ensete ventricosum]|nr:hypothetical protein BHE74_00038263 [Ensete ventricosum]